MIYSSETHRAQDDCKEDGREESSVEKGGEYERLFCENLPGQQLLHLVLLLSLSSGGEAYGEFSTTPQSFYYSELIECHTCEQDFGAVGVAYLPREEAPELVVGE